MLLPLTFHRTTQAIFVAGLGRARRNRSGAISPTSSSLFKLSLEQGQGPYKQTIADSSHHDEEYHAISAGLRIDNLRLHRDMQSAEQGGLWLVLERLARGEVLEDHSATASRPEEAVEAIQVEILTELRIDVGAWGTGQG